MMIKSIQQMLTRNIGWKVFSLLTAITLWCIVINIKNPTETRDFPVYITVIGEENLAANNIVLANKNSLENTRIMIKVRGNRLGLEKLKASEKNIVGTVNLQSDMLYSTGSGKVNVNIKLPTIGGESFEIIERNPQYVDVKLEKVETVQKPVKVALVGEPKDGFVTSQPKQTPSTIQIKGASSTIAKVDTVRVYADVSGATSDIDVSAEPRVYDAEGNELLGLELSVEYVKVKVGINEYKKVTIDGSANQGMLADGYTVTAIEWEPKTIEVVGSTNEINAFTELKLPSINLSGLKENKVVIYDLRTLLPANISIRNGTPYEAKVTVKVEKEAIKQVDIPIANLTVSGLTSSTQQYKIVQEPVKISLKGLSSVLDKVTITDIKGNIDISQYTQGVYDVPVKWTLPQGTVLVGNTPTVNVTISAVSQETKTKVETKASTQ